MQDQQRMTSERMGTPNARSLGQQRRRERERALRSMQLATPPSTQGWCEAFRVFLYSLTYFPVLNAHIVDAQPSVDNHWQAGQTQEQQSSLTTPQSSSSSTARSLAQQRRRERERASLRGFVQLTTPPSTQRELRQSDGAFRFSFNSSLCSHMLSRPDTKRSTHDPSTHSGSPQSE